MSLRGAQATRQSRGFLFHGLAGSSLHGARFVIGGFTDWSMERGLLLEGSRIGPWGAVCYWRVHGLVHGARFVIGGTSLRVRWVHSVALWLREGNVFRAPRFKRLDCRALKGCNDRREEGSRIDRSAGSENAEGRICFLLSRIPETGAEAQVVEAVAGREVLSLGGTMVIGIVGPRATARHA